jgi:hypothetical protein
MTDPYWHSFNRLTDAVSGLVRITVDLALVTAHAFLLSAAVFALWWYQVTPAQMEAWIAAHLAWPTTILQTLVALGVGWLGMLAFYVRIVRRAISQAVARRLVPRSPPIDP